MSDPTATIIQTIVSGALTGGASAATTFLAVFKDIKKRISELEQKVGSDKAEPKTGLFFAVEAIAENLRRLRRDVDSWRDEPPEWVMRAIRNRGSSTTEIMHDFEERVETRLRTFQSTMKRLEDELDRREQRIEETLERSTNPGQMTAFISREEYEEDSRRRAAEITKIRENLSAANSCLRGVMTALGYIDTPPREPDPPPKLVGLPPPPKRK